MTGETSSGQNYPDNAEKTGSHLSDYDCLSIPGAICVKNNNNTCKIKHLFSLNIYIFFSSDLIKTPLFTTNKLYKLNEGNTLRISQ